MPEDSGASVARAWHEYKLVENLRNRLSIQGTIPGEIGIRYLMDNYRRLSEALVPFIRVVSDGVCILEDRPPLQATTGFTRRCNAIKDSEYADLLCCFDPAIRASESHAGTEVYKETGIVILTDRSTGLRRVIGEYKFESDCGHDARPHRESVSCVPGFDLLARGIIASPVNAFPGLSGFVALCG